MRKILFLILGGLTFHINIIAQPNASVELYNYIEWSPSYQLNWADFKGQPGMGSIGDAGTFVSIKAKPFVEKKRIYYMVHALFNSQKSWYRDQSSSLLAHEQLHFDIAELYARKARRIIIEIASTGEKDLKVYNRELQKILNESNVTDQRYDAETLHGSMNKKQQQWKDRILKELLALERYKDPRVEL